MTPSFVDIQQQEKEFKESEDLTYSANGKWFIDRRERAGPQGPEHHLQRLDRSLG